MLNLPNLLSICRILLVPPLVVVLLTKFEDKEWWGLGLFLLAAIMDFFDGYLARRRREVTRLGMLLDPAADKILISAAFISLVEMGEAPAWMVVVIVAREFAVSALRSFAAAESRVIPAGFSGKLKTVVQIVAVAALIIHNQLPGELRHISKISLWAAVLISVYSGVEYFVRFRRFVLAGEGAPAAHDAGGAGGAGGAGDAGDAGRGRRGRRAHPAHRSSHPRRFALDPGRRAVSRLLAGLARLARRRYRAIFVVFAVLAGLSAVSIFRLSFDTDMLNLLPRRDPAIHSYVQMLQDFGSNTYVLVVIELPEGAVPEPYESLADDLAAGLARLPEVKSVQHRLGNPEELLAAFFPKSVLFLDDAGRREVEARLSDDGIRRRVSELRRQLSTPQALSVKELAKLDPLGLSDLLLGHVASSRGTLQVDWASGYYLSRDHRLLLVLAEPRRPPQDIPFDERLIHESEQVVAGALGRWGGIAGPGGPARPKVEIGGPYVSAIGDAALIRHDMFVNAATSALAVLVLFLFAFRRAGALVYAFVPLLTGLVLTFGFAGVAFGALSSATSVCAALLIGLGIDFVIVSYGRYVEERNRGRDVESALATMSSATGGAVIAGATTTAATFYAFTFTGFTGLRQMGLLTGTGILFCMVSVLLLLPAMLAWSADHHQRRRTEPRFYLHSFGTRRLTALCMRHPLAAMSVGAALTLAALAASRHLSFDESMATMRPTVIQGSRISAEVGRRFGSGFDSMILSLSGRSLDEVLTLSERAAVAARPLVETGALQGVSAPSSLIPPRRQQQEVLDWLARGRSSTLATRVRARFAAALREEGLRPEPFAPGLDLLASALSLSRPIGIADFAAAPQTELLLDRYLKRQPWGWRAAVYLYPPPDGRWRREVPPEVTRLAAALGPRAQLAGINVINQRIKLLVVHDAWIAGVLGLVLVAAILWIDFRSVRSTVLALVPLLVGITLMVGGMVAFGIPMNFVNIFVTTMIIGIGTDYGIYVMHRYDEERGRAVAVFDSGLRETGKAVAAAAISTIVGFGSIVFSHYPALQSTGKVAVLGAFCTSLVAITLLPAYLWWSQSRRAG